MYRKTHSFLLIMAALLCFVIFSSHAGGRAAKFGQGNTGAPGETATVCSSCHQGGSFGTAIVIKVLDKDNNAVTTYEPNEVYTIEAKVNTTTAATGYGIQLVSLLDNDEDSKGLSNASSNAQISQANDRIYLEQKGMSSSPTFTATWKAPESESKEVSFYAFGVAVDGSGNPTGDKAAGTSLTLEKLSVSVENEAILNAISISNNLTSDMVYFSDLDPTGYAINVYDMQGALLHTEHTRAEYYQLDLSTYRSAQYIVQFVSNKLGDIRNFHVTKM